MRCPPNTDNPGCDVAGMNISAKAVSDATIYFELLAK
jgi:hypothetical protein